MDGGIAQWWDTRAISGGDGPMTARSKKEIHGVEGRVSTAAGLARGRSPSPSPQSSIGAQRLLH